MISSARRYRWVAPRYAKQKTPKDQAERVVEGAVHLSPHLGKRMVAGKIEGKPVFIRELLPQDLKFELEQLSVPDAMKAASFLRRWQGLCAPDRRGDAQKLVERAQSPSIQIAGCAKLALVERGCARRFP